MSNDTSSIDCGTEVLEEVSVLYVEDSLDIAEEIIAILKRNIKTLFTASNGKEGLELYKEKLPDVVITDIRMPVMNGIELAREIKKINPKTPIIITTAFNDQEYFLNSIDVGIDAYILKPVNPTKLINALTKHSCQLFNEREIERKNRYIEFIFDSSPTFMVTTNGSEVEYVNATFLNALGYASLENFQNDNASLQDYFARVDNLGSPFKANFNCWEYMENSPDESHIVYIKLPGTDTKLPNAYIIYQNHFPELHKNIFTFTDVSQIEKERLDNLSEAQRDPLTGAYNRKGFYCKVADELARAHRYGIKTSLTIYDIDHFKLINDTYGHQVGDSVLKELTNLIMEQVRSSDVFCRWGGEEFIIFTPHTDVENIERLAEKLRKKIEGFPFQGVKNITCSFGVTQYIGGEDCEDLIKRADDALYKAKNGGRNRVVAI